MAKKKKINLKRFIPFCIICAAIIAAAVFGILKLTSKTPCEHEYVAGVCEKCGKECEHQYTEGVCAVCGEADPNYVPPEEIHQLSIVCGGDVMAHITNIRSQYLGDGTYYRESGNDCETDGSFDFSENFQWLKPYISEADLAMVNVETTFNGGPNYSGSMSKFNAPDELAKNLAEAGFDVAFTCNNHSLDRGISGLKRTVEVLRNNGMTVVGTRTSASENRSSIVDVNGVKVGIVAYTYETGRVGEPRTLNGSAIPEGANDLLNSYRFTGSGRNASVAADEDKALIAQQIEWCEENGADIIIGYFHWDRYNEYVESVTALEKDLAKFAAEHGVDIIFGSHPHIVQTVEVLKIAEDGKTREVPVFYSLGNFISNQNKESFAALTPPDPNGAVCQEELLAHLNITYNKTKDEITFDDISAIPLYVARYHTAESTGKKYEYRIFPLVGNYSENADLIESGQAERANAALQHITSVIGAEFVYQ